MIIVEGGGGGGGEGEGGGGGGGDRGNQLNDQISLHMEQVGTIKFLRFTFHFKIHSLFIPMKLQEQQIELA